MSDSESMSPKADAEAWVIRSREPVMVRGEGGFVADLAFRYVEGGRYDPARGHYEALSCFDLGRAESYRSIEEAAVHARHRPGGPWDVVRLSTAKTGEDSLAQENRDRAQLREAYRAAVSESQAAIDALCEAAGRYTRAQGQLARVGERLEAAGRALRYLSALRRHPLDVGAKDAGGGQVMGLDGNPCPGCEVLHLRAGAHSPGCRAVAGPRLSDRLALDVADRSGPSIPCPLPRLCGETAAEWCDRAAAAVIAAMPPGYRARRARASEDGVIVVAVVDRLTGRAIARADIVAEEED